MPSAIDFLPSTITLLITCWTSRDPCTGSGSSGRTPAAARRGIARLLGLHAVLRAGLLAVGDAGGVERPAHDLVAHAREVLDAAAADEHYRVLLQVVPLARDVARDLHAVGEPHAGDLAQSRVRLLRRGRIYTRADAATLRGREHLLAALTRLETRRRQLLLGLLAALADELIDAGHAARDASSGFTPIPKTGWDPREPGE